MRARFVTLRRASSFPSDHRRTCRLSACLTYSFTHLQNRANSLTMPSVNSTDDGVSVRQAETGRRPQCSSLVDTMDNLHLSDEETTTTEVGHMTKKDKKKNRLLAAHATALKTFEDHYTAQFGEGRWPQLFESLKAPTRYCCLLNKYVSVDKSHLATKLSKLLPRLRQIPWLTVPALVVHDDHNEDMPFPPPSSILPQSTKGEKLSDYYLLDAASLLATEALDVQPTDWVLDLCAAPGGKSLSLLQRLDLSRGGRLTANELSDARRLRLRNVLKEYIGKRPFEDGLVEVTGVDGTRFDRVGYDRVLVDAPCSSDRHLVHSLKTLDKWNPGRLRNNAERQRKLLAAALKVVRPGGTVVYATCSLSEIENDMVVERVVSKSKFAVDIVRRKFDVGESTKYGTIVLPDTGDRWGPLYFAVLKKSEDALE